MNACARLVRGAAVAVVLALAPGSALASASAAAPAGDAGITRALALDPLFADHAVLQRDAPIDVRGGARPGARVRVTLAGREASAAADRDGRWRATLPALPAGGPHVLVARSDGAEARAADVLLGDVWLCSGQSNMELQVWRALDARAQIEGAGDERIRLFEVPKSGDPTPRGDFAGPAAWQPATPASVREFSAACWYFARELRKTVDVPMGLVSAAWGGSRIEAWTSGEALRRQGGHEAELRTLSLYADDPVAAAARWGDLWTAWYRDGGRTGTPWDGDASGEGWADAPVRLGAWERWGVPALADYDGMVWYRSQVVLDAAQADQSATLQLGPADEMDLTWVNGRAVGSTYGAGDARAYRLPHGLLHAGANTVVVNVLDTYREGGLAGPADAHALALADGSRIPLDAHWRWHAEQGAPTPPRAPWQTAAGLSTLHNGMIAPLRDLRLKGALWYQGESNTGEPDAYAAQLRALRDDWRRRFGDDLAFLVVQLANYGMPPIAPGESGWAGVREAQRAVARDDPRSALAVAIDIGERYDIHPANKQELGRRLARAARRAAYAEPIAPSGPAARAATRAGDTVAVAFDDVDGALSAAGGARVLAVELCGDAAGSCRYVDATADGTSLRIAVPPGTAPTRVRHAWADSPVVNLFDGAGLPAGPFELPIHAGAALAR